MAIRQEAGRSIYQSKAPKPFGKKVLEGVLDTSVGHAGINKFVNVTLERGPERLFAWEGKENIALLEEPLRKKHKVILVANHISQGDVGPMSHFINDIRAAYPGHFQSVLYTLSASMEGGQQGKMLQLIYRYGVKQYLDKYGIDQDPVVSTNDVLSRYMVKTPENGAQTRKALNDSLVLQALHPEGWMQGGRVNKETENINGLQKMDRSVQALFISQMRSGVPTVIFPLAIEGTEEIFDPASKNFTLRGLIKLSEGLESGTQLGRLQNRIAQEWMGSNDIAYKPIGVVRIGKPRYLSEIAKSPSEIPDAVQRTIAENQSPRFRGEYGSQLLTA